MSGFAGDTIDGGLWIASDSVPLHLIVKSGDALPAGSRGSLPFQYLKGNASVGDGGDVAFGDNFGTWRSVDGQLSMLCVPGEQIPGLPSGWQFAAPASNVQLDAQGNAVMVCWTESPESTYRMLLLWVPVDGGFSILAEQGNMLNVDGVLRQIAGIGSFLGAPPQEAPFVLNDHGQVVMRLSFVDGTSGVFIASIPEPSVTGFLSVAIALLSLRNRKPANGLSHR